MTTFFSSRTFPSVVQVPSLFRVHTQRCTLSPPHCYYSMLIVAVWGKSRRHCSTVVGVLRARMSLFVKRDQYLTVQCAAGQKKPNPSPEKRNTSGGVNIDTARSGGRESAEELRSVQFAVFY